MEPNPDVSRMAKQSEKTGGKSNRWWKETIVYQVYPRSFADSNGDGIGDLPGLIDKLDYIKSLGVGTLWLNPVYDSPNDDNGYDISDYEAIMPEFGTMEDFDRLLTGLHDRGIKLLMDLVVNHTSDEHRWFKEARKSRDNPYRNYYIWWNAEKGDPPYRFSFFDPQRSAWQYDETTNAYYLHYFSKKQPDLNWENPALRESIYEMMRFWFNKGVDGFRLDAITFISKDMSFPDISRKILKENYEGDWGNYYASGPRLHEFLHDMHEQVFKYFDVVTIAECPGISKKDALLFVQHEREELDMMYHFEGMQLGLAKEGFKCPDPEGFSLVDFKKLYSDWDRVFEKEGWGTIYLGNHDQPRMVTRWGNDAPEHRANSAKMLITFLLGMRATPIFYNGDELGMVNIKFDRIEDYRDVETLTMYQYIKNRHGSIRRFLENQKTCARDNGRTPFQWDATDNAGFTTGKPWIRIHPDHVFVNREAQEADGNSVLNYFRRLVQLRKEWPALIHGDYTLYDPDHSSIYAYTRTMGKKGVFIVLNFSESIVEYPVPGGLKIEDAPLINNETSFQLENEVITLLPYQALIFELNQE